MLEKFADKTASLLCRDLGMHIEGNHEIMIENCRRIEEYNDIFMRLISGRLVILIWGSGLRAFDYKTQGLIVRGRISQIEFIERNSDKHEKSAQRMPEDQS